MLSIFSIEFQNSIGFLSLIHFFDRGSKLDRVSKFDSFFNRDSNLDRISKFDTFFDRILKFDPFSIKI